MNNAAAAKPPQIDLEPEFMGEMDYARPEVDPNLMRWGINPGEDVYLSPREIGLKTGLVPCGRPFPIVTFKTKRENCTTDENQPKEIEVLISAAEVEQLYNSVFHRQGFRSFALGEKNQQKMLLYGALLLPPLSEVGMKCPYTDEQDLGARDRCAKCHYDWLVSDELTDRIRANAADWGLNPETAQKYRQIFIEAYAEYIVRARELWQGIVNDFETGQQNQIHAVQHQLRKNIHEMRPQDKNLKVAQSFAEAQSNVNNSTMAEMLAYLDEKTAQREERMLQMFEALIEKTSAPAAAEKKK